MKVTHFDFIHARLLGPLDQGLWETDQAVLSVIPFGTFPSFSFLDFV